MGDENSVKLVVMPFTQHFDAASNQLSLRVLLIPRDPFITDYVRGDLSSPKFFPNVDFKFSLHAKKGLQDGPPTPGGGDIARPITLRAESSYRAVFNALVDTFGEKITKVPKRARDDMSPRPVRKHLPVSYRTATGYVPRGGAMFTTDNTYSCAMRQIRPKKPWKVFEPRPFAPSWGELLASILRIPDFAEAAGLIRTVSVQTPPGALADGAFLWLELDPDTALLVGIDDNSPMRTFAARIPPTRGSADLFTPLLFPVGAATPANDTVAREAEEYADGWAKAVHCEQPSVSASLTEKPSTARPAKDLGVRIGWDDEQVTIWADRQIDPSKAAQFDKFPLGVRGYRVDVQDVSTGGWFSLSQAKGDFGIGSKAFGSIGRELGVEIHPAAPFDVETEPAGFWMPMYFASWAQSALVGTDEVMMKLLGRPLKPVPERPVDGAPTSQFPQVGVTDPDLKLRYGKEYNFRVRLMDLTGGGPKLNSVSSNLGPSPTAAVHFKRWIKPLCPRLVPPKDGVATPPTQVAEVLRPLLFYPAVVFANYSYNGKDALTELQELMDNIVANPPKEKSMVTEPGLPDPDVDRTEIKVCVRVPPQDPLATDGPFMELYTTTRLFPTDLKQSQTINLNYVPCPDVWDPPVDWSLATTGDVPVPRSRDIKFRIRSLCRTAPTTGSNAYFGAEDVLRGPEIVVTARQESATEPDLFVQNAASQTINAFFLQPAVDAAGQLAAALGLRSKGTTLHGRPGKRTVFACSSTIMHVLGPDRATVTFVSQASLALHWIVAIRLTLKRDWTWDGFPPDGIKVTRDGQGVAVFAPVEAVNEDALAIPTPDRSTSEIVILDVINPTPEPKALPAQLHLNYQVSAKYRVEGQAVPVPAPPIDLSIDLPVTTRPAQVPELTSAGLAMSPYAHDEGYTTTVPRDKMLWVEFAKPPFDPDDRYFCRVLHSAPDPLLVPDEFDALLPTEEETDPPLPVDPEPIRSIVPGQSLDTAGMEAMQPLIPTSSSLHWGIPLPPGLTPTSASLLGFFTYEFRLGHWNDSTHIRWSTAQARFGPPLRVAGVQHPVPTLPCTVSRDPTIIRATAPFSSPLVDGRPLRSVSDKLARPPTEIWFQVYAQVAQVDGSGERRNVLVARRKGELERAPTEDRAAVVFFAKELRAVFALYGLRAGTTTSVVAVEMMPQQDRVSDPLGGDLGRQRILRTSCLVAVPELC